MQSAPDELDRLMGERVRHRQEYQRVLAHRDDEIDRLNSSVGPGSESWRILIEDKANARAEFEAIAGQLGRPVNRLLMNSGTFYVLAIACAAVEAPVNKFLFDIALQSNNLNSYVVSFTAAAFLLIAAHMAGKLTRQVWSEFRTKLYVANIIIAAGIMTILLGVVSILMIGRAEFSAATLASGLEGLFSLSQKVASQGFLRTIINALSDTSALILATFNVLSILAAYLIGYLSHDPDRHFDKAFEKHKGADRALEKRDDVFKSKIDKARERARSRLDEINTRYTAANAAIVTQKTARRILLDEDDRASLPDLDRLLESARRGRFAAAIAAFDMDADGAGADRGDRSSAALGSLVKAGANLTRVPVRDPK